MEEKSELDSMLEVAQAIDKKLDAVNGRLAALENSTADLNEQIARVTALANQLQDNDAFLTRRFAEVETAWNARNEASVISEDEIAMAHYSEWWKAVAHEFYASKEPALPNAT